MTKKKRNVHVPLFDGTRVTARGRAANGRPLSLFGGVRYKIAALFESDARGDFEASLSDSDEPFF